MTGMARFHVHGMRHTFACPRMDRGGNPGAMQQVLARASVVTMQRYETGTRSGLAASRGFKRHDRQVA